MTLRTEQTNTSVVKNVRSTYFRWLCDLVNVNADRTSFYILAGALHKKEFYGIIPNDVNRSEDGKKLREVFANEADTTGTEGRIIIDILSGPCSMLEMLIALAQRIDYMLSDDSGENRTIEFFWEMLDNLGLADMDDELYFDKGGSEKVNQILEDLLGRHYRKNGAGGLFPLRRSKTDQRTVEIWYQMCAYLEENHRIPD